MSLHRLLFGCWLVLMCSACGGGGGDASSPISADPPLPVEPPVPVEPPAPIEPPVEPGDECEVTPPSQIASLPSASGSVLVFSETQGFRHASIPNGIAMMRNLALENGWDIDTTEDSSDFTAENLARYNVVVWLNTTGDVLSEAEQDAFQAYIEGGGGYVGIHSAADTEFDWPWYEDLVGAYFLSHPEIQEAQSITEDTTHPASEHLDPVWTRTDEWYNFRTNPRDNVNVISTLDESSYNPGPGAMGDDHPITWYHEIGEGRSFYTGMGHTAASYTEANFVTQIEEAVLWAGRMQRNVEVWLGDPPPDSDFTTEILASEVNMPLVVEISNQGQVYVIGRMGEFYALENGELVVKSRIEVGTDAENGLIGIALDPNFDENRHVFLHYTNVSGEELTVSRMVIREDNTLDFDSEVVLLRYDNFPECCHQGGDLAFDSEGDLYIAIGDNSNPFESNGFTPIDERPGRIQFDAQRTSANTNDFRGKILRITPTLEGGYTIPEGNLFEGDELHRPEIYTMGHRNPFRIGLDPTTDSLLWGEVGPDANQANALRGPAGMDEINQTRFPGNFGWPYFVGDNQAYIDFDFATGQSSDAFDLNNVINNSVNNTGATNIPNALPAWLPLPSEAFMLTDVYRWNPNIDDESKLPSYFNGRVIYWNFNTDQVFEVELASDNPVPRRWLNTSALNGIIDAAISPVNNRLYFVAFGGNCCGRPNDLGMLAEVRFTGTNPGAGQAAALPFSQGDQIAFGLEQGRAVSVDNSGAVSLAEVDTFGEAEVFEIVDAGDGAVAFRSQRSNQFLSLEDEGQGVVANASTIGDSQRFDLIQNPDGSQSVRSLSSCEFVGATDTDVSVSFDSADSEGARFRLRFVAP